MFIIIISTASVVLLVLTAWVQFNNDKNDGRNTINKRSKEQRNTKKGRGFFKSEQLISVFQEVIIVFLSAILAIWLTEFVNDYNTQKDISSLMEVSCNAEITQLAQVSGTIKDIIENNHLKEYSLEDKMMSADSVIKSYNGFAENILSSERVMSQLTPISYTMLDICIELINMDISYLEDELKQDEIDQQKIAKYMVSYCSISYKMAFYFECLSKDIKFDLPKLALLSENEIKTSIYYKAYIDTLNGIGEIFDIDISEFKEISSWFNS